MIVPTKPDDPAATYADTGCALWRACLSCPFPECIDGSTPGQQLRALRDRVIRELYRRGYTGRAIGERIGLADRTVSNIAAGTRRPGRATGLKRRIA